MGKNARKRQKAKKRKRICKFCSGSLIRDEERRKEYFCPCCDIDLNCSHRKPQRVQAPVVQPEPAVQSLRQQ